MSLIETLERQYQHNEQTLASSIAVPKLDLDADLFNHWVAFCRERGVRHLPGSPAVVAVYIHWLHANQATPDIILKSVETISAAHSNVNLPNPVACAAPRAALLDTLKTEPPKTWSASEKFIWATLDPDAQSVISKRDKQTTKTMRNLQNENAELRRQISEHQSNKDIKPNGNT